MIKEVKDHLAIVHTKNNLVGHVTIEIMGPAVDALSAKKKANGRFVRGFYPLEANSLLSVTTIDVPGMVKNDAVEWDDDVYISSQGIAITRSQAEAMIAHANREERSPQNYDLNDQNCVDFGNDMLRAGGLPGDVSDYLTQSQIQNLNGAILYSAIAYGGVAKGKKLTAKQRQQIRHGTFFQNRTKNALSPADVLAKYAKQGILRAAAVRHWAGQVSKGGYGQIAAERGLTVREAEAIYSSAHGEDIRGRGFSGMEMIAGTRYSQEMQRSGDPEKALDKAQSGLAAARTYNGPSQELSPGEKVASPQDITNYIDTFRNRVELSRVKGNLLGDAPTTIRGVPADALVSVGSRNAPQTPQKMQKVAPRADYTSPQMQVSAQRAQSRTVDTSGFNMDLLSKAVSKAPPGSYTVSLGGWSPVGGVSPQTGSLAQNVSKTQARASQADIDLLSDVQKNIDRDAAVGKARQDAAAQAYARENGLLSDTPKSGRASAKEDTLDGVDFSIAKTEVNDDRRKADALNGGLMRSHEIARDVQGIKQDPGVPMSRVAVRAAKNRAAASKASSGEGGDGASSEAGSRAPGSEALYERPDKNSGEMGNAGYTDAGGNYHSGTTRSGAETGGSKVDDYHREVGAYGQFTRDIMGRTGDAASSNTRVICTELVRQGLMAPSLQRLDIAYTLRHLSPATVRGYHAWAVPYVRLMKRSPLATYMVEPLARWRAEEIAFRMKARSRPHYGGRAVRVLGEPLCWLLGTVLGWVGDPERFHPERSKV